MRLRALFFLLLTASARAEATPEPVATPAKIPDWFTIEANLPYDRYPATVLDILQPTAPASGKRPGVIMFHGGGWIRSTKETMMGSFCIPYLRQGFVVANVEYRVASMTLAPAAVNDALKAAQWFFEHAAQYQVDPARIVVTGGSAGGHLALMVGMTPESAGLGPAVKVAAVINGYGITDVADLLAGPHRQSFATEWIPEQPGRDELARQMSPLTYVRKDLPPILTVHGADDHTVPTEHGTRLTQALRAAGADAELIIQPGAKHGFSKDQWPGLHAQIFAFLKQRGVLP